MDKTYKKRIFFAFIMILLIYAYAIYSIVAIISNIDYSLAVAKQHTAVLNLEKSRGTIYDCNMSPLTNDKSKTLAVAMPSEEVVQLLKDDINIDANEFLSKGRPLFFYTDTKYESDYIDYFEVPDNSGIASNLLGYTDYSGHGVTACELAFDNILSKNEGQLNLLYNVDALGKMIVGMERKYNNSLEDNSSGVLLSIDKRIQTICEKQAEKIEKGAIVVVSVPDCEIKASVSIPSFDANHIEDYLESENAPLINRAFTAFSPGSVMKTLVATTALKYSYDTEKIYCCEGSINVNGHDVDCFNSIKHSDVNMQTALEQSCNGYFIRLAQEIGAEKIWQNADIFEFGKPSVFYEGLQTESGVLSDKKALNNDLALANFTIGQGDLTVTPIKMAEMINCFASDGIYRSARLYLGEYLADETLLENYDNRQAVQAMNKSVAREICKYMTTVVENGTAQKGEIEGAFVGAKTGTAQTSIEGIVNYWYAGFVGDYKPEYVIVVLAEGAKNGQNKTADVFKNIGNKILNLD